MRKILSIHTIVSLNISCLAFIIFTILFSNVQAIASDDNTNSDIFDKANVAELFDMGSGVFAIFLSCLSLGLTEI